MSISINKLSLMLVLLVIPCSSLLLRNLLCFTRRLARQETEMVGNEEEDIKPCLSLLLSSSAHLLKCYYDKNHTFSIEAILRHKAIACMRKKCLLFSNIFFCSRGIQVFKIKLMSSTQPCFDQI